MFRFFGYLFGIGTVMFIVVAAGVTYYINEQTKGLPDYEVLSQYEPPVMTRIHASDGALMAEFAEQRRLFLPSPAIPDLIKAAFLSAEDKNFYSHAGIDLTGIGRAVYVNIENRLSGRNRRLVGASTITQQVAKNFLLTSEQKFERKVKEMLLSLRIEAAYSKEKILELYLNEIYLGLGAYGVGAASLVYFDRSVSEISLAEAAYLAALPKAPTNYHPFRHKKRAIGRRNWVLDRMVANGYISVEDAEKAKAEDLVVRPRVSGTKLFAAEYFAEDVRRELIRLYGRKGLYEGGLSVRTTLDPRMQVKARRALQDGLIAFDRRRGWRGPHAKLELKDEWGKELGAVDGLRDLPEWTLAVVLDLDDDGATVGLQPAKLVSGKLSDERVAVRVPLETMRWARWATGARRGIAIKSPRDILATGDVIFVEPENRRNKQGSYALRQVPEIEGAITAMDPYTGRVLAMVGGFSFDDSQFNRASQARRQPGSSFKPFVYAAALDNGYTPSSVVLDAEIAIDQGNGQGIWKPKNYGDKFYGPSTLRLGIERSRNAMTVRLAKDMGMPLVAEYSQRFGIYDNLSPVLAMSLGAGETTALRMVSAYSVLANGGRKIEPTLIDRIQDRYGKTVFKHDKRVCEGCEAEAWNNQDEPVLIDEREQVLDPMTAYQITSMMEGVVKRGTGVAVQTVGKPIAGKTGTTNDEKDAWFVGYAPDLVVGVFIGYDTPRAMGRGNTGGQLAAPIFASFMKEALKDKPPVEFRVPEGLKLIPINRKTGLRASAGGDETILEAFKPGTAPPSQTDIIGYSAALGGAPITRTREADRAIISGTGGLY
ncbi:MAG: penicillin-binding protein 1A [Pseudomonadota bacterium]